ncbi:alpha/beta hydrolase [Streptomyces sp. NPDC012888]|uniref:alpha/beta hydrolase n=1 Tax=Streptomyces sp. NPDC012888 TaxID=3364855 RepID=UPI0036B2CCB0
MRLPLVSRAAAAVTLTLALGGGPTPAAASGPGPGPGTEAGPEAGTGARVARRVPEARGAEVVAARAWARGLEFRACPAVERLPAPVRCALLRVPLDYARPDGPQITLTVSRVPATGRRQGALVHNPGGPGASGMYFPLVAELPEWRRVAAAYDLVGYAPRGVGRSAPLSCAGPATAGPEVPGLPPDGPSAAHKRQRIAAARAYAAGCARRAGPALPYYTTPNNARDLYVLRAALGEPRLNFFGASYGTYFGAVYATLYPRHVRRMVFDSAVDPDPARIWYGANLAQSEAFERRWYDFRAWVARHHSTYRLGATPAAVQARWDEVRHEVSRRPAAGRVGTAELHSAYLRAAYYDEVWPERAAALTAFLDGDPAPLVALAAPDPEAAAERENAVAVYTTVLCNDAPWPADFGVWDRDHTELDRRAPFATWANGWLNLPCAYWPVTDRQTPVDVGPRAGGLPPTLIAAAERDAATPYRGALELQRRLGPRAALVTERGSGAHGVVGGRNACVDRHVERYLLTGRTPGPRAECAPHPEPAPVSLD